MVACWAAAEAVLTSIAREKMTDLAVSEAIATTDTATSEIVISGIATFGSETGIFDRAIAGDANRLIDGCSLGIA